jgi:hypothetical protein
LPVFSLIARSVSTVPGFVPGVVAFTPISVRDVLAMPARTT